MKYREPSASNIAESHEITLQAEVELAVLFDMKKACRIALHWKTDGRGNIRKLSTLRFVMGTFDRHLRRMRVLSEYGDYIHIVTETKPYLAPEVDGLKKVYDDLQARLEQMLLRLEHVSPADSAAFEGLCVQLEEYFDDLDAHGQKEMDLLQYSFDQEQGGSG